MNEGHNRMVLNSDFLLSTPSIGLKTRPNIQLNTEYFNLNVIII